MIFGKRRRACFSGTRLRIARKYAVVQQRIDNKMLKNEFFMVCPNNLFFLKNIRYGLLSSCFINI